MEIAEFEKELREIKETQDKLKKRESEIKEIIKLNCDKEHSTKYGGISVQIVPAYYTLEFNIDEFKAKHNDLYEEFLSPTYHEQQLKVVLCKEKREK